MKPASGAPAELTGCPTIWAELPLSAILRQRETNATAPGRRKVGEVDIETCILMLLVLSS